MATTRVTLKHVSKAAGVSVQTVSHILGSRYRSLYHPETCDKVLGIARELGYRPNAAARSMASRRSHIIGVLVRRRLGWFSHLDVFETMIGMDERLASAGYVTSIIPVGELRSGGGASRALEEQLVDGMVAIGQIDEEMIDVVEKIAPAIIWCDTNVDRPTGCLRRDEYHAGRTAAQKALEAGYRRLVWLTYDQPSGHYSCGQRWRGISEVAADRQVPVDVVRVNRPDLAPVERRQLLGCLAREAAVITENHHFAQAVVNIAARNRLVAGSDFGLASCDHSQGRGSIFPELSCVQIDRFQMGMRAADMLLGSLAPGAAAPASAVLQGTWFEGQTLKNRVEPA